jgi:hypothetical protein
VLGQQEVLGHVEHEQRLHSEEREALPHFGAGEDGQTFRVTEQGLEVQRESLRRSSCSGPGRNREGVAAPLN